MLPLNKSNDISKASPQAKRLIASRSQVPASTHAGPMEALNAAVAAAEPTDRILVFGSFYTVGGVLAQGIPRLAAKHLG